MGNTHVHWVNEWTDDSNLFKLTHLKEVEVNVQ